MKKIINNIDNFFMNRSINFCESELEGLDFYQYLIDIKKENIPLSPVSISLYIEDYFKKILIIENEKFELTNYIIFNNFTHNARILFMLEINNIFNLSDKKQIFNACFNISKGVFYNDKIRLKHLLIAIKHKKK